MLFHSTASVPDDQQNRRKIASARQAADLTVDDPSLAEIDLAARVLAAHHDGDARLLVGCDRAQQVDERNVLDRAEEALVLVSRMFQPLAVATLQQRARSRDDLLHVDRSGDEIVGAGLEAAALALDVRIQHQHDGRRQRVALLGASAEVEAVGIVGGEDDQIGTVGEALAALLGVARDAHREAGVPQAEIENSTRRFVPVDNQDRLRALTLYLLRLHSKVREYRRFSTTKMVLLVCKSDARPTPA